MPSDRDEITMFDLRPRLTEIISSATNGTTYTVTRFGKPVVTIGPYQMDTPSATSPDRRQAAVPLRVGDDTSQIDPDEDPLG